MQSLMYRAKQRSAYSLSANAVNLGLCAQD